MALRSMTGYGQAASESAISRVSVSARTVNHRFLDVVFRLPEEYRAYEGRFRKIVDHHLSRGRVEIRFEIEDLRPREIEVEINQEVVQSLVEAVTEWTRSGVMAEALTVRDLLRVPEAIRIRTAPTTDIHEVLDQIESTLGEALVRTDEGRAAEGEKLGRRLQQLVADLEAIVGKIAERQEEVRRQMGERLEERLRRIAGSEVEVDSDRVAQELALLIDRADIREELDRLSTHLEHFAESLAADGAVGRRLDFLAQEMLRELNTLASKCRHTSVVQLAIDGKLGCEQIREQVQNLE